MHPAVLLLPVLTGLPLGLEVAAADTSPRFRYDAASDKCVDARGEEGLNPAVRNARDNQCADFRGQIVMYLLGDEADFRGANFDGAEFRYLNSMQGADLTGARLTNVVGDVLYLDNARLARADLSGARLRRCEERVGTCLAGARFDARTILPFSREEARARGMVASEDR